jgi:hypothetical protein
MNSRSSIREEDTSTKNGDSISEITLGVKVGAHVTKSFDNLSNSS